ncbi:MAG: glycosyltransferase, partial [Verrucomicrobia bacterium]|nr:glycosyltransferase [Verrucomicrobiota bacterium]
HACDLFCLPSREGETWGLVVNEALLHGLPVVVSEGVGCAPDLVAPQKVGQVVKTNCAEDLFKGLKSILGRGNHTAKRTHCRKAVEKNTVIQAAKGILAALKKAQ